jgi:WD40 repeat protein
MGSLDMAERRESNYFQAATRDVVNTLQANRGKRSGLTLQTQQSQIQGQSQPQSWAAAAAADSTSSAQSVESTAAQTQLGASSSSLKMATMDMISSQLKRNALYKQHGPGTATAIHVNSKYFVVGTSNGLLLVFDFFQEIRQVVGSTCAQGTRCYKAVTVIDMTPSGNFLVCGYASGEIALWDVNTGAVLKRVADLHKRRVTKLAYVRAIGDTLATTAEAVEFWTVSADAGGACNRGRWSKTMWGSYNADFDCLIDGSAGALPALNVLAPIAEWNLDRASSRKLPKQQQQTGANAASSKDVKDKSREGVEFDGKDGMGLEVQAHMRDMQLLAFNTLTRTYIVQIQPVIRVLHRWAAPVVADAPDRPKD